jgi:CRP/FNR family transcriptional regulator, cyclic AMP receptor protein
MFLQFVQDLLRSPRLCEGSAWVRRQFTAGESLTTEGRLGQSLFIVERGRLAVLGRAERSNQSALEITIAELSAGDVFGESSLIGGYESIATVRALTDGGVLQINGAMLMIYLDDHPDQGYLFFKYLLALELDNMAKTNRGVVDLSSLGFKLFGVVRQP